MLRIFGNVSGGITHNILRGKKWLEVNFPLRGKVIHFPSSHKNSFSQTLQLMGKQSISRERESYFQGKIISEGKFAQLSLGGKMLPQKMLRVLNRICF